eukprot:366244-Chlamydomonas_euryale.AAC.5
MDGLQDRPLYVPHVAPQVTLPSGALSEYFNLASVLQGIRELLSTTFGLVVDIQPAPPGKGSAWRLGHRSEVWRLGVWMLSSPPQCMKAACPRPLPPLPGLRPHETNH